MSQCQAEFCLSPFLENNNNNNQFIYVKSRNEIRLYVMISKSNYLKSRFPFQMRSVFLGADTQTGTTGRRLSNHVFCSLRSRRWEVVGTRINRAHEKETRLCVSTSRAPVLSFAHYFQAPATQATFSENTRLLSFLFFFFCKRKNKIQGSTMQPLKTLKPFCLASSLKKERSNVIDLFAKKKNKDSFVFS